MATALLEESGRREPKDTLRLFGHEVTVREVSGASLKSAASSEEEEARESVMEVVKVIKEVAKDIKAVPKESLEMAKKFQG